MDWTHKLKLRNLEMLLSLEQTGSMSRTAHVMHTTQPGLSKWLKELEDDIGVPLFERYARGLRPTVYGRKLLEYARCVHVNLDNARDELAVLRAGGGGLVTVGLSGASCLDAVSVAVVKALETMPTAHIRLFENTSQHLMERLGAGEVDIVVGLSDFPCQDPDIRSEYLYQEPILMVARLGHPLMQRKQVDWDDLRRYPWALWAEGTSVRTAFDCALTKVGQHYPPSFVESNSASITLSILLNTDMVGIASRRSALRYQDMNLLAILPIDMDDNGSVSMYWKEHSAHRLSVQAALEGIRRASHEYLGTGGQAGEGKVTVLRRKKA